MAKKTTKKKAAKTSGKTKASSGASKKKTTKKTTKSKATTKKSATKSAAKKPTTKKSATKKKTTKTQADSVKTKKTTKKSTKKAEVMATDEPVVDTKVNPSDNGKADANVAPKPTPVKIHRVVRPTPPPPAEQDYDDWTPLSDAKLRRIKSGLSRKELNEFKQLLLEKRAEIIGDVAGMEESRSSGNGGQLSNMPLHMADIGSDNYEQEFTLGLVESERKLLVEIDRALQRIENKTYGVCVITGNPIPKARLEIKPWAKYSIEIVREREKRGLHSF